MSLLIQDYPILAALGATQADLDRFIQELEARESASRRFLSWKTLEIGSHENIDVLTQALEADKCHIGDYARQILKKTPVSPERKGLNLVRVTGRQLGFDRVATRKEIYDRAISLGLQLCPAEVGPQLRRVYIDQSYGEWLRIAMEPIEDSVRNLLVFNVGRDDGARRLRARNGHPDDVWNPANVWVFVLP